MSTQTKIALGGGCHWCTEAVFQSLKGVFKVAQGYVSSTGVNTSFSEAVIVYFNNQEISLDVLIDVHLHTHKSTSSHSMRKKYRSAIYTFSETQKIKAEIILKALQNNFKDELITEILPFNSFKPSRLQIQNYYYNNLKKPFCETFINPKLKFLLKEFSTNTNKTKLKHLEDEQSKT